MISVAFDIYVPRLDQKAWLIDINPFDLQTDGILYNWQELLELREADDLEFRLTTNERGMGTFATPAYSINQIPKDVIDASAGGENIAEFAKKWMNMMETGIHDE